MGKIVDTVATFSLKSYFAARGRIEKYPNASLFALGCFLLLNGLTGVAHAQFDPALIEQAVCDLFTLIEGAFGALIMTVAGIGAIISASMGAYRAAVSLLFTGCGSFILRSLVSLYFDTTDCSGAGPAPEP